MPNSREKRRRREVMLYVQNNICLYCGRYLSSKEGTLEHLVPVKHGGTISWGNIAVAHAKCNRGVKAMSIHSKMQRHPKRFRWFTSLKKRQDMPLRVMGRHFNHL